MKVLITLFMAVLTLNSWASPRKVFMEAFGEYTCSSSDDLNSRKLNCSLIDDKNLTFQWERDSFGSVKYIFNGGLSWDDSTLAQDEFSAKVLKAYTTEATSFCSKTGLASQVSLNGVNCVGHDGSIWVAINFDIEILSNGSIVLKYSVRA
jgi:hypothetical protein